MNFLVAAATSSLSPDSKKRPPRKRVRRTLKIDTSSRYQPQIHKFLSELISSLQPLTPLEHDMIQRAFLAGLEHESASAHMHSDFAFNESDFDSSDNEISSLQLLAHAVYTKKHNTSPARPALKRRLSEETFTVASFLGQMRHMPDEGCIKKSKKRKIRRAKISTLTGACHDDKAVEISKHIARKKFKTEKLFTSKNSADINNLDNLGKTAVQVVALLLSPAEISKLQEQFKVFDKDGSGKVSLAEMRACMEKHAGMDPKSIEELFSKIDSDHTGLISYSEFISASLSTSVSLTEERLAVAFDKLDPDKSGFIDVRELENLLKETVQQSDIDKIIVDADAYGEHDGKISRKEFIKIVQKH